MKVSSEFGEANFSITHKAAKELAMEFGENQAQDRKQLSTKKIFNLSPKLAQ